LESKLFFFTGVKTGTRPNYKGVKTY